MRYSLTIFKVPSKVHYFKIILGWASLGAQTVKSLPAIQEIQV